MEDRPRISATKFLYRRWAMLPEEFVLTLHGRDVAVFASTSEVEGKYLKNSTLSVHGTKFFREKYIEKGRTVTLGKKEDGVDTPQWKVEPINKG